MRTTTFEVDNDYAGQFSEFLRNNDMVELESGDWTHIDEATYIESCGEWYANDECCYCEQCSESYLCDSVDRVFVECVEQDFCCDRCAEDAGFHRNDIGEWTDDDECGGELLPYSASNPIRRDTTPSKPYLIGFEVEKEDSEWLPDVLEHARSRNWIAVSDGSLASNGWELVSPAYNLDNDDDELERDIMALTAIDAQSTTNCGGHITLSKRDNSGPELATYMGDFVPLLFALFPKRLRTSWASPKKQATHNESREKYRAVNVQYDRVEFRIFSRVKTRSQLLWRVNLIRLATKSPATIAMDFYNESSELYLHLRKVYSVEQIEAKRQLFASFVDWYHTPNEPNEDILPYIYRSVPMPAMA